MQSSSPMFAPRSTQGTTSEPAAPQVDHKPDNTSELLLKIARFVLVGFTAILPLFFLVGLWGTLGFQKVLITLGAVGAIVIILSLLALRSKVVKSIMPLSVGLYMAVVLSAVVSALFSPDWQGAFRGSVLEIQTVGFMALLGGVMLATLILQGSKKSVYRVMVALMVSTIVALSYIFVRLIIGPILAFGSFGSVTVSPIGNFNDMAVFAALAVILSLITMVQLRLTKVIAGVFAAIVGVSLVVLAAVNFFYVWLIVGFFGLLMLLYLISQDTLFAQDTDTDVSRSISKLALGVTTVVCLVSGAFVVGGDVLGGYVSRTLDVEYLEVRPSLGATVDILQATYSDDLLFGAGPNQFTSSWRAYKDPSINQTIFWNTDFQAGSGYIPTLFVNLGLLGVIAIIAFHGWFLIQGGRMLLRPSVHDAFWYFVAAASFAGAVFLWGISYIYIPGATLLILAALLTGLSLVAGGALQPERVMSIRLASTRQRGFVLMALAIVVISGAMGTWFTVGKQYVAQSSYAQAEASTSDIAALDQAALAAYQLYPDDRFLNVRARIALLEMNQLLGVAEPTETDQQRFLEVSDRALIFAEQAIAQAPHEPTYYALRAGIFNNLAIAGIVDAIPRATSSIAQAAALDPQNPSYALLTAQLAANRGDVASARPALQEALQRKSNLSEALYLLAQLDIAEGNTADAIATTEAIIRLEPNNPTRYYQLGILESANGNNPRAAQAYQAALSLDPNFANARYLLALIQVTEGEVEAALTSLRTVAETNQENEQLQQLIASLEAGDVPTLDTGSAEQVNEAQPVVGEDGVTSAVVPDSDLLTPLNTVSETESSDQVDTPIIEDSSNTSESESIETESESIDQGQ